MALTFLLMCALGVLFFILLAENPMTSGFGLAIYSLVVALLMAGEYSSYFSYLLYFIYVGTLMVMFCMVVSLAPNPVFQITPLLSLFLFQTGGSMVEDVVAEDLAVKYSGGVEVWGDSEVVEAYRWCDFSVMYFSGNVYEGLGVYQGVGWGCMLLWLGLVLLLSVISVANMCKRSSGPLVRFIMKAKTKSNSY